MNVKLVRKLAHLHDEHNGVANKSVKGKKSTSAFHSDFVPEASVCEVCPPMIEIGFELPKDLAEEQRRAHERARPQNVDRDRRQSLLRNGRDDPARPELRDARAELLDVGLLGGTEGEQSARGQSATAAAAAHLPNSSPRHPPVSITT